jgi:acetyltransferase-like isoleucine patch superfamily enzyme
MITSAIHQLRHWRAVQALDSCGEGTRVHGAVDKRGAGSRIDVGSECTIDGLLITEAPGSFVHIGNNVLVGGQSMLTAVRGITVEDDVLISYQCIITDSDNHSLRYSLRKNDHREWMAGRHDWSKASTAEVRICKGAWLGARVIVTKGVTIGEGAVCGMGSVVTRDVAPYTVVAGNPARVIRELPPDER